MTPRRGGREKEDGHSTTQMKIINFITYVRPYSLVQTVILSVAVVQFHVLGNLKPVHSSWSLSQVKSVVQFNSWTLPFALVRERTENSFARKVHRRAWRVFCLLLFSPFQNGYNKKMRTTQLAVLYEETDVLR